jgi:hypothetical protein
MYNINSRAVAWLYATIPLPNGSPMMSHRILPAALLLCALAAACGENPAGSDMHAQPVGPAYDGGFGVGSGNSATQSSGSTASSESGDVAGSGVTIGSGSEVTEDGGFGVGSGNVAAGDAGLGLGSGNTSDTNTTDDTTERGGFGVGSGN